MVSGAASEPEPSESDIPRVLIQSSVGCVPIEVDYNPAFQNCRPMTFQIRKAAISLLFSIES